MRVDDSSNVRHIGFDSSADWPLTVEFVSGAVYRYKNVQQHQFVELCGADSIGGAIRRITGQPKNYPFEIVSKEPLSGDGRTVALQLIASLPAGETIGEISEARRVIDRARIAAQEALK